VISVGFFQIFQSSRELVEVHWVVLTAEIVGQGIFVVATVTDIPLPLLVALINCLVECDLADCLLVNYVASCLDHHFFIMSNYSLEYVLDVDLLVTFSKFFIA